MPELRNIEFYGLSQRGFERDTHLSGLPGHGAIQLECFQLLSGPHGELNLYWWHVFSLCRRACER
jgi:hypothetical protein